MLPKLSFTEEISKTYFLAGCIDVCMFEDPIYDILL